MRKYFWLSASLLALAISAPAAWGQSEPDLRNTDELGVELGLQTPVIVRGMPVRTEVELPGPGLVQNFFDDCLKTFQAILQAPIPPENDLICPAGVQLQNPSPLPGQSLRDREERDLLTFGVQSLLEVASEKLPFTARVVVGLLKLVDGCTTTWQEEAAVTLPSADYLRHPPQYFPPSPPYPLPKELKSIQEAIEETPSSSDAPPGPRYTIPRSPFHFDEPFSRLVDLIKNCWPIEWAVWDPDPSVRMEQLLVMSEELRQTRNEIARSRLLDTPSNLSGETCCPLPSSDRLATQFGVDQPSGFASSGCSQATADKSSGYENCSCKWCGKNSANVPFLNNPLLRNMSSVELDALRNQIGLLCQARQLQEMALMPPPCFVPHAPMYGMGCPMMAHPPMMGWLPPPAGYVPYPPMPPAPWMGGPMMPHPPIMMPGFAQVPPAPMMPPPVPPWGASPPSDISRGTDYSIQSHAAPPWGTPPPAGSPVSLSTPATEGPVVKEAGRSGQNISLQEAIALALENGTPSVRFAVRPGPELLKIPPQPTKRVRAEEASPAEFQIDARSGCVVLTMPNLKARCQRMTYVGTRDRVPARRRRSHPQRQERRNHAHRRAASRST